MAKKLIVNADDFGQSKGANNGIIKAHESGIVTSASLMVLYPHAVEAAEYAKRNPALSVGLHLDLGEWIYSNENWEPIYQVTDINDQNEVAKEIRRQLEMFFEMMGRKPSHMDSHQHVHLRELLKPVITHFADEHNILLRRCNSIVGYCGDFYGQDVDGSSLHGLITVMGLDKIISGIPDGITELACHPGLDNDLQTMYGSERELEVNTLCDPRIRESVTRNKIELHSFNDVYKL